MFKKIIIKVFCIQFIMFLISCQTSTDSDTSKKKSDGGSPQNIISTWSGTSTSLITSDTSDITFMIYDNNTFTGTTTFNGNTTAFSGSGTISVADFSGTGTGTMTSGINSNTFTVHFIGTIAGGTVMSGSWAMDYATWTDDFGTFSAIKQ